MTAGPPPVSTAVDARGFLALARRHDAVPLVRTFLADLTTPVAAFRRLRRRSADAFLLESIQGGEAVSRWSFAGSRPVGRLRVRGGQTLAEDGGPARASPGGLWEALRRRLATRAPAPLHDLPPFLGGAVGWLGYGAARWFEPALGAERRRGQVLDDALLLLFPAVVAFDHARQRLHVGGLVDVAGAETEAERLGRWEAMRDEVADLERALLGSAPEVEPAFQPELAPEAPTAGSPGAASVPDPDGFLAAVARAREHIQAGDAFQVVLSRRFETAADRDPLLVYRALRTVDPAPYMFLVQSGEDCVLGASPETLLRVEGRRLLYRPIAGTRPRGRDAAEDLALEAELRADPKEVAEHVMLVDLGRNDLGRVARTGSVRVERLMEVERYARVMHLVSTLSAELRDDRDRLDALAACFPAGTVSGAPKVRAMQIIDELEPVPRGVYGGAVLYLDRTGNLDACIAIRTLVLSGRRAFLQAGAGIVNESVPERELEETSAKAAALLRALELARAWPAEAGA